MAASDSHSSEGKSPAAPVAVDYARADADFVPPLRTSTLLWFSSPAIAAMALLAESLREIKAAPDDPDAGATVTVLFFIVLLVSGLTSGAVALSVFEARKTMTNVWILVLNLMWVVVCIGWLLMRIFR